ncbi:flagellar biosynthesis anti-sigma factor FlgM [Sphingomonas sp. 2R-10]|uniref:flagellar biosynthesis anti-sigma factor FlgM n=1 Tax=Sphingomonas sp. 2R-10 TaxID=3045148 RepID=UPI000F7A115F|nr:flagellar biosynthesis anti-sigma factor FlgM [Sphingomonas sp. 2R-10]MDJ0276556.1 flagellar biosynthesis anti-sigma factor FlgM [Sphingomonas sp. 2R-10]
MVDAVGSRLVSSIGGRGVARTEGQARTGQTAAPQDVAAPRSGVELLSGGTTAKTLSASPPVDTDRVATIRKAISEGRFPLSPATIADRLIALKLDWNSNEPA